MVVRERTTKGITKIIAERSYAWHLLHIGFHCKLIVRQSTLSGTPTFTIYKYVRVYIGQFLTDKIHRLDVMNAHKVDTESVDMVLLSPISHALEHKLTHQRLFRSGLISTSGAIAWLAVSGVTIVSAGVSKIEVAVL